ncbi:MAG: hypothetical protein ACLU85_13320 [Lachnospirales bacterium]
MNISVGGGYVNIKGKTKHFEQAQIFTLEKASGTLARIDNVILRRDDTERDFYILIETGGFSKNPVAPEITRTEAIHDLKLAEIRVEVGAIKITQDNITDTRMNADVCGWVMATVKEIDFSQITAQFQAFFQKYQAQITEEFNAYQSTITNLEDQGTAALHNMENQFETYAGQQEELFTDLYNRIKDQLSKDAAAALWFSVNALQANFENLATKIMFENQSKETAAILIDITNENSGTVTTATYAAGGKTYLTEPGTYKVEPQADNLLIIPKTFVLDHTQTTETLNFTIYDKNAFAAVGGYVGAYVSKN